MSGERDLSFGVPSRAGDARVDAANEVHARQRASYPSLVPLYEGLSARRLRRLHPRTRRRPPGGTLPRLLFAGLLGRALGSVLGALLFRQLFPDLTRSKLGPLP